MQKEKRFPHVFSPLKVRGVILKNRLQYAPTVVLKCAPNGDMTQDMIDFMKWQAQTGVAYVTVGDTPVVHDGASAWLCEMNVNSDDCIHGMNALVMAARRNGAELSVELAYAGRGNKMGPEGMPAMVVSKERLLNPEDAPYVKEMDAADMEWMKQQYVNAAVRCKIAGFRMVMLHCAHNNFLAQWLSPDSNVRTDAYGGSPENRRRYPLEVLQAVREAVGENMVIEIRVSAQEDIEGGLQFEESLNFMEAAQEYVDIIHVSRGSIFHPRAAAKTIPTYFQGRQLNVDFAAEAKKRLHVPVCVVGNITSLAEAEEIIAQGKADLVAMAKSYMADGDLVKKSLEAREEEIRPCTRCDLCGNANNHATEWSCAVNPRVGMADPIVPVSEAEKKHVMVIGGGPAGMMAAQTLMQRGHTCTLYEKGERLGGLLQDAVLVPFKNYMRDYLAWDIRETMACGAKVCLNHEVTVEDVEKENPDAVIVATGSSYVNPPIPGMELALPVRSVDAHEVEVDGPVVVCGGGVTGLECALTLAMEGKRVTVVDLLPEEAFVSEMPIFNRADLLGRLSDYGVTLRGGCSIVSLASDGVTVKVASGKTEHIPAGSIVNALGVAPNQTLGLALMERFGTDVYMVGDCVSKGRNYYMANHEGYDAAMRI